MLTVAAGLSVLLAACGGGTSDTAAPKATTAPPVTRPPVTTLPPVGGGDVSQYCALIAQDSQILSQVTQGQSGPDAMRTLIEKGRGLEPQLLSVIPPEIAADVQIIAATDNAAFDLIEAAGFDITKVDQAALDKLVNDPKFQAATDHADAYYAQHCGTP